ncbi:MAG: bifunctional adenosylcobinamide kinase/adenosylcobinamide-phosphate guanylyltransferase [Oscillospiraceae bacterium]
MMILITGGSKCGKSRIAEEILSPIKQDKFYIATMEPHGEEAERAISTHRRMRAGKNFLTIEQQRNIGELALPIGSSALLECIPTLTANEMFGGEKEYLVERIVADVVEVAKPTALFVAITNDVGCDGIRYSPETAEYIKVLGEINRRLADIADTVIESVYGIPVILKGELP